MNKKFEVVLVEEALSFIDSLDLKTRKKIYYNLDKARHGNYPKLFKKLTEIFGNSGQNTPGFSIAFLHFGTKQRKVKPW